MPNTEEEKDNAKSQARAQFESIREMMEARDNAEEDSDEFEEARTSIEEDPLSVQVRSGWCSPGAEMEPEEFEILLCTGGPACRIIGELNEHNEPDSVKLQYQDWFTPWEEYHLDSDEEQIILDYCRQFYFAV